MDLQQLFDTVWFSIGDQQFTVGQIIVSVIILAGSGLMYSIFLRKWIRGYVNQFEGSRGLLISLVRNMTIVLVLIALIGLVWALGLNRNLFSYETYEFDVYKLLAAVFILYSANFVNIFSKTRRKLQSIRGDFDAVRVLMQQETRGKKIVSRVIQVIVICLLALLILKGSDLDRALFSFKDDTPFLISKVFSVLLILLIARLIAWVVNQFVLFEYFRRNNVDAASQYAINQLVKYVIYVLGIYFAVTSTGVSMTLIWGGLAALLVGIGLGLQQTFNDLFSGIILLTERTIEVGNYVEVEGLVGAIKNIGLRTSVVETRENIAVIIPNSKLVNENVVNWSHYESIARFNVDIGVAYGSDTRLVESILLGIASSDKRISSQPEPIVWFGGFGDSSLDFQLLFWTKDFLTVEKLKSDLRFMIDEEFRKNGVQIPFPQRDLWIKQHNTGSK